MDITKKIKAKCKKMARSSWERLRSRTRKTLRVLPYVLLVAGVVLCIVSLIRIYQIKEAQTSQIAAEQWSGDSGERYIQLSCFARGQQQANGSPDIQIDPTVSLVKSDIVALRTTLDDLVRVASGVSSDGKKTTEKTDPRDEPEVKLWVDAYSSEAKCTVARLATDTSAEIANETVVTGVGGDYYLFHPLMLIEGSFLSEDGTDTQTVVLDESLSWLLFGSYHAVGQTVKINDIPYTVVGVVRKSDTKIDKYSYGKLPRAYILFDELSRIFPSSPPQNVNQDTSVAEGQVASGVPDASNLAIQCYEVIIPNQLDGIAKQNLISAINTAGKDAKNFMIVQNTGRFSLLHLYDTVFPLGAKEAESTNYRLSYWEISARIAESFLVFWWTMVIIGLALSLTSGLTVYTARRRNRVLRV